MEFFKAFKATLFTTMQTFTSHFYLFHILSSVKINVYYTPFYLTVQEKRLIYHEVRKQRRRAHSGRYLFFTRWY